MQDKNIINLHDDKRYKTKYGSDEEIINSEDCPKEVRRGWVIIEHKGKQNESLIRAANTQLEAFRFAKSMRHEDWVIVEADITITNMMGLYFISGYEEI